MKLTKTEKLKIRFQIFDNKEMIFYFFLKYDINFKIQKYIFLIK